jgi:ABC-type transport system involved in multi-copper enzyme maturation permease subunit
MVGNRMNYAGALLLILIGVFLYSWDPDVSTAGIKTLALPSIIAGLVWAGLALNNPLRERRYHRPSQNGSLRVAPAPGAGYRRHRGSRHVPACRLAAENLLRPYGAGGERRVAMNAPATVASGSVVQDSLRIATKEAKENLCGARASMWAVLSAIVLALTSSDFLFTGTKISLLDRSEILYTVTSLAVGLGLLVAGLFAADSVVVERRRTTLEETLLTPTKRGALLLGKVLGITAVWLLIFGISAPYILVVGFGTGVSWVTLTYTFVLGTLCVAGFATLTVGLIALSRSGRGATLVFLAIFATVTVPTLLGPALRKSWFGDAYNVLSPFAQARLSLESTIVDKESLLVQLPYIGTLAAFAVIAGAFAAFAIRGGSLEGSEWREGRGDRKPRGPHDTTVPAKRTGPRLAGPDPEKTVGL